MQRARAGLLVVWALAAAVPAAGQGFTTLKGHGGPVMGISVEPVTGLVGTASFDNSVGLWRGRVPQWLEGHDAAVNTVLFASADRVLSAADDFTVIDWDATTGEAHRLSGHKGKVVGLALSPGGGWIASASWDGSVGLWPTDGAGDGARFLSDHTAGVNAVAFTPDGRGLYSASTDGTLRYSPFDPEDGSTGDTRIVARHGFGINALVLSPGMDWLAYGAIDGGTRVIAPATGETLRDFTLDRRPILAMAHHPGSGRLAVGDGHGFIMMIDTESWRITHDFRAMRRGPVWALALSPDGETVYAGGLDDAVYAWPVDLLDRFEPAGDQASRSFLRDAGTMPNGERQFMRKCSICHSLDPAPSRKAGPTLRGVFGRPAGTVADYPYSETLTGSDIIWNEQSIDALFDLGPDHYIPGSKMPMQRITRAEDRQDLIKFLRSATAAKEN